MPVTGFRIMLTSPSDQRATREWAVSSRPRLMLACRPPARNATAGSNASDSGSARFHPNRPHAHTATASPSSPPRVRVTTTAYPNRPIGISQNRRASSPRLVTSVARAAMVPVTRIRHRSFGSL